MFRHVVRAISDFFSVWGRRPVLVCCPECAGPPLAASVILWHEDVKEHYEHLLRVSEGPLAKPRQRVKGV